jgi:hypothetical protein
MYTGPEAAPLAGENPRTLGAELACERRDKHNMLTLLRVSLTRLLHCLPFVEYPTHMPGVF